LFTKAFDLYTLFGFKYYREAYVSDEIWYVTATRNILVKILGIKNMATNDTRHHYYTLVFASKPNLSHLVEVLNEVDVAVVENGYAGSFTGYATVTVSNTTIVGTIPVGSGLNAVYVKTASKYNSTILLDYLKKRGFDPIDVVPGWALPDKFGINNYLNTEHPPLGKYFIALSTLLLGDHPIAWRIPSIAATTLVFVFAYLVCVEVLSSIIPRERARWLSLAVPLIMLFDNVYHTIGILAMLDPFLSLLTIIGVYIFIKYPYQRFKHMFSRTTIFSLAGLVKYSGLFIVPAEFFEGFFIEGDRLSKVRAGFTALLRYYLIYPLMLVFFSLPLISYLGLREWFEASILDAFKWHLSTKTPPGSEPTSSSPIDWLLGFSSFTLWIDPATGVAVKCTGMPLVYITGFILGLATIGWTIKIARFRRLVFSFYSIWSMYMVLYLLGNKSLYSFYIIHFSPILTIMAVTLATLLLRRARTYVA